MRRLLSALVVLWGATFGSICVAQSQPNQYVFLPTVGSCGSIEQAFLGAKERNMEILFTGGININMGPRPEMAIPLTMQAWIFVNQDKGSWNIMYRTPDGYFCNMAQGFEFTPYNGPSMQDMPEPTIEQ